jgi:hypothetical protein
VVRTRKVRALTEKYYGRVAWLFIIHASDAPEAARPMAAALRRAANELEVIEVGQGVCVSGVLRVRLTPEDARRFERRLEKFTEDLLAADTPAGRQFVFAHAYFPRRADA